MNGFKIKALAWILALVTLAGCGIGPATQAANESARTMQALNNIRFLIMTATVFHIEEGRSPTWEEFVGGIGDPSMLVCPLVPDQPIGYVWVGIEDSPSGKIAIYSKGVNSRGERPVGYDNGSARLEVIAEADLPPGISGQPENAPPASF